MNSRKQVSYVCIALSSAVAISFLTNCGTKSKTDAATAIPTVNPTTVENLVSNLSLAVPGQLALSAFPQNSSKTTLDFNVDETTTTENQNKSLEEEVAADKKILEGKSDSCLSGAFTKKQSDPTEVKCYEFDQDMIYGQMGSADRLFGTKNGKDSKGEACLVSFARSQILKIKDQLDRSKALVNAALCQATKDEKEKLKAAGSAATEVELLPKEVGESVDLAPYLTTAFSKGGAAKSKVTKMTLTRLANVDSREVYQTLFTMTDESSNTRTFTMNHSPKDANNEEYDGVLFFLVKPPTGQKDPVGGQTGFTSYVSISYARTKGTDSSFTMNYEARSANFATGIDPITSTGQLDYNATANFTVASSDNKYGRYQKSDGSYYNQDNEAAGAFKYIAFSNNETTKEQKLSYWVNPGSNYKENARGMVFSAKPNTDGFMEGCANSGSASTDMGSGTSIRRFLKEGTSDTSISLSPKGFYHPFFSLESPGSCTLDSNGTTFKYSKTCQMDQTSQVSQWSALTATGTGPNDFVTKQGGTYFSSQCYKQNSSGVYEIDTTKTTGADGFDLIQSSSAMVIQPPAPPKGGLAEKGDGKIDMKPKSIETK